MELVKYSATSDGYGVIVQGQWSTGDSFRGYYAQCDNPQCACVPIHCTVHFGILPSKADVDHFNAMKATTGGELS